MQDDPLLWRADTHAAETSKSPDEPKKNERVRLKPDRPLPTPRVTFEKQLRCLRSYGLESHDGTVPVSIDAVGKAVPLNSSTVSLCNPFFVDVGFLEKSGRGAFTPSREVLEMVRAYEWDRERAPEKLAPVLLKSWPVRILEPRLRLNPLDANEAIQHLADNVRAGRTHESELSLVLDYLCVAGIIRREGNQISWIAAPPAAAQNEIKPKDAETDQMSDLVEEILKAREQAKAVKEPTKGGIRLNFSIDIDTDEISRWPADRITAFLAGLAQVLAAQRKSSEDDDD